jgi:WhiB family redox-sensing transcriptional regulator
MGCMRSRAETDLELPVLPVGDDAPSWQEFAECVNYAGRVDFFPARGESVRDAKEVCATCRVRVECLDFALRMKVAHGVWGGLSERERRTLRRDRNRAPVF